MEIQISRHARERAAERGTNEAEIKEVLSTGFSVPARYGKMGKGKVYEFARVRAGKYYAQKRVEVIYTRERDSLIAITVYVFYGKWR